MPCHKTRRSYWKRYGQRSEGNINRAAEARIQGEPGSATVPGDPSERPKCIDPTVFRDWLRRAIEAELSGLGAPPDAWSGAIRVAEQAKYILDGFSHKQGIYR